MSTLSTKDILLSFLTEAHRCKTFPDPVKDQGEETSETISPAMVPIYTFRKSLAYDD